MEHPLYPGMAFEVARDLEGGRGLRLHPHRQGLAPLQGEPGHERRHDAPGRVLHEAHRLGLALVRADHRPAHRRVVAVQVLGGGVDHEVRTKLEGALIPRREQGVVHDVEDPAGARDLRDGRDVGELEGGVRRGLGEDEPGRAAHARLHRGRVRGVGEGEFHPEAGEDLPAEPKGAAEDHVRDDRVAARPEEREQDGVDRGHTGTEGAGVRPPFERGEPGLERPHGGVVRARVRVAPLPVAVHGRLHEGRRLVDGGEDRPRRGVGLDPRAHLPGREAAARPAPPAHFGRLRTDPRRSLPPAALRPALVPPRAALPGEPKARPGRDLFPAGAGGGFTALVRAAGGSPTGAPIRDRPRSRPPAGTRSRSTRRIPARR